MAVRVGLEPTFATNRQWFAPPVFTYPSLLDDLTIILRNIVLS